MIKLSNREKEQVEKAISDLEKSTSGEVVVYIAKASHAYKKGIWIPVTLAGALAQIIIYILGHFWLLSHQFGVDETIFITLSSMVFVGVIFSIFKRLRLLFVDKDDIEEEVLQKAQGVFITEDIFNTKERTGILIFISQLEHKVLVLGDEGINAKIEQANWDNILQTVISGIKTKNVTPKLIEAIKLCKDLLLKNGFNVAKNDFNELSNHVRVEE